MKQSSSSWLKAVRLNDAIKAQADSMHEIPVREWNAFIDELNRAIDEVRRDPVLMKHLQEMATSSIETSERELLYRVLRQAPLDHGANAKSLLADPRVRLDSSHVSTELSIYVVEQEPLDDDYPFEELGPDEDWRDLTRIGGNPTTVDGFPPPTGRDFLLQVDLAAVAREAAYSEGLASAVRRHALPKEGLLQVFHSTTGDSRTTADSGGGATVRLLPEEALRRRTTPAGRNPWPAWQASCVALPSVAAAPGSADDVERIVNAVSEDLNRAARNGSFEQAFLVDFERNPFTARVDAVTRMFALSSPDFEHSVEDSMTLASRLPLAGPDDKHVLLFDIPADRAFGQVFGDSGRLEIWIRATDAKAHRFDEVASFIRSA